MDKQEESSSEGVKLESAAAYLADAFYDLVRISVKSMASVIAARQFLWLRNWVADASSKSRLSKLPYKGRLLFGEALEKIVKDLGDSKGLSPRGPSQSYENFIGSVDLGLPLIKGAGLCPGGSPFEEPEGSEEAILMPRRTLLRNRNKGRLVQA